MESIDAICTGRPVGKKLRKLALGVFAAAALSMSMASVVTVTASPTRITPASSHRLALLRPVPGSVRLT
jgi:hypothetical protein